jgi:peroxiredoxin
MKSKNLQHHLEIAGFVGLSVSLAIIGFYLSGRYLLPVITGDSGIVQEAPAAVPGQSILGHRAPDFSLPDLSGNRTTLAESYGVPVIVTFWAAGNQDSADQVKILDDYRVNEAEQAQLVDIVAIDSLEDPSIVMSFMRRGGYNIDVLTDQFGAAGSQYGVKSLPTTYFISKTGVVEDVSAKLLSESDLTEKVDNLLKQNAVQ